MYSEFGKHFIYKHFIFDFTYALMFATRTKSVLR
jgi:hypothetical protein